ncbi:hypothetical protein J6590_083503 [Homalodisca vitripennis]|nr:hypothetical protein J6590_083503 [Homalodisca vitripennis]
MGWRWWGLIVPPDNCLDRRVSLMSCSHFISTSKVSAVSACPGHRANIDVPGFRETLLICYSIVRHAGKKGKNRGVLGSAGPRFMTTIGDIRIKKICNSPLFICTLVQGGSRLQWWVWIVSSSVQHGFTVPLRTRFPNSKVLVNSEIIRADITCRALFSLTRVVFVEDTCSVSRLAAVFMSVFTRSSLGPDPGPLTSPSRVEDISYSTGNGHINIRCLNVL